MKIRAPARLTGEADSPQNGRGDNHAGDGQRRESDKGDKAAEGVGDISAHIRKETLEMGNVT